ncbi:hypothetical protein Tco_0802921 [Tanacetum coccineum]|uniref:Uncharacterized protein n=1 Tax=Tanacetum coccineum TaxID=301880 RepID=A0ABQ5A0A9_9ASTR
MLLMSHHICNTSTLLGRGVTDVSKRSEDEELEYPFFEGDGSSSDECRDYGVAGDDYVEPPIFDDDQFDDDYEGPPVFDDYPYEEEIVKEESMSVYDTDIEDVTEEEEGFVGKGEFGGEEENIEDVVVVVNDIFSSMIQTTLEDCFCFNLFAAAGSGSQIFDVKVAVDRYQISRLLEKTGIFLPKRTMDGRARPGASNGVSKRSHFQYSSARWIGEPGGQGTVINHGEEDDQEHTHEIDDAQTKTDTSDDELEENIGKTITRKANRALGETRKSCLNKKNLAFEVDDCSGRIIRDDRRSASTRNILGNEKLRLDLESKKDRSQALEENMKVMNKKQRRLQKQNKKIKGH